MRDNPIEGKKCCGCRKRFDTIDLKMGWCFECDSLFKARYGVGTGNYLEFLHVRENFDMAWHYCKATALQNGMYSILDVPLNDTWDKRDSIIRHYVILYLKSGMNHNNVIDMRNAVYRLCGIDKTSPHRTADERMEFDDKRYNLRR